MQAPEPVRFEARLALLKGLGKGAEHVVSERPALSCIRLARLGFPFRINVCSGLQRAAQQGERAALMREGHVQKSTLDFNQKEVIHAFRVG